MPNSDCIPNKVTNWTYSDSTLRNRLPVGVAYGTDLEPFRQSLLKVAGEHTDRSVSYIHPGIVGKDVAPT